MKEANYLGHTPRFVLALRAFRSLISLAFFLFALVQTVRGLIEGEIKIPVRSADITVTAATPGWFTLALLAWMLMCGLFAFLTIIFGRQFLEALRR